MVTQRLEIRLDEEYQRKLSWLTELQEATTSAVLRQAIDHLYEEIMREERHRAIEELCAMEIEDMPDPEELNRQLESTYDVDLP